MIICDKLKCTSCGACCNICPKNAIEMQLDNEGFYRPVINENCIECGKCEKICPANHPQYINNPKPECYAVMANDDVRMRSSSGGAFEILADYVFEKDGYVCGVVWNEDFSGVYHTIINDKSELHKMQGSKYIQSDTKLVFSEIKELLSQDKWVLFSGCPCQVAGLNAVLGKEYEKLITVDLLCHGVPSVKVWNKYIKDEHQNKKIISCGFKEKEKFGWHANIHLKFEDNSEHHIGIENDDFFNGYLIGLSKNTSCGGCKFAKLPRQGNFTIGDFWGIANHKKELFDKNGVSIILVNNQNHTDVLDYLSHNSKTCEIVPLEVPLKQGNNINVSPRLNNSRNSFFKEIFKQNFYEVYNKYKNIDYFDVGIVGIPCFPNFGGVMTYFALYNIVKDLGYSVKMIGHPKTAIRGQHNPSSVYEVSPYSPSELALNYLNKEHMTGLNHLCDTFLVGSDQLFHINSLNWFDNLVYLDFVKNNHKKIAYAASFGHDSFTGSEDSRAKLQYYMQKYDAFSCREESGVNICREQFGVESNWVLDPVFLCEKEYFVKISENATTKSSQNHIFAYILDPTPDKKNILREVSEKIGLSVECYSEMEPMKMNPDDFYPEYKQGKVEERLYSLINSDFIVTDSFHGTCFAIIFNKPFITIINKNRGATRFEALLSKLNLFGRTVLDYKDFIDKKDLLFNSFDFKESNQLLSELCENSRNWLKTQLEKPLSKGFSALDLINDDRRIERRKEQFLQIQMAALFNGKKYIQESRIINYLDMLITNKGNLLTCIAVKDTPGHHFNSAIFDKFSKLGLKNNLTDKHWNSYLAVIDNGTVVSEITNLPKKESRFANTVKGLRLKLVSKDYNTGNIAFIEINDVDYSENNRGINIVLFDREQNKVIDSVCFDTHSDKFICYRNKKICNSIVNSPINIATIEPVKNEPIKTETSKIEQKIPENKSLFSERNQILLHNFSVVGALGGSVFDYYIDKGIKRISIYGNDMLVSLVWQQAYYKNVEIVNILNDNEVEFDVRLPRTGKVKTVTLKSIDLSTIDHPILVLDTLIAPELLKLRINISVERLGDLLYYSHYKRALFDNVLSYSNNKNVNLVVLNSSRVYEVKNPSKIEKHLRKGNSNTIQEDIYNELAYKYGDSRSKITEINKIIGYVVKNGVLYCADKTSDYVNCVNGFRVTVNSPIQSDNTIFFFGNSTCYGVGAEDKFTVPSVLQRKINESSDISTDFLVINCANAGALNAKEIWDSIFAQKPVENNIIVLYSYFGNLLKENYQDKLLWLDTKELFDRPHNLGEVFWDIDHLNFKGYEAIGEYLFNELNKANLFAKISSASQKLNLNKLELNEEQNAQLELYINSLKTKKIPKNKVIGSIVMNCNPFTLGHRYLIEYASSKVDKLVIFVVEEDRSAFKFADRFELVKKGVSDLKNVIVVPSGKFIISQTTFRAYFKKEEDKNIVIDATSDIAIFAEKIAPALNITVRFAGEEPLDPVTNQYNSQMANILPHYGIEFNVIPRREIGGEVVSASRVRKHLEVKDFESISKIVPETTLTYLKDKFAKNT